MHHELEAKLTDIHQMKENLVSLMKAELAKGCHEVDTNEAGEVIDMIKDLAQVEKDCWKAEYYKTVTKAMEEHSDDIYDEEDGMGYNPSRSSRTGRYTSRSGRSGSHMGRMGYPYPWPRRDEPPIEPMGYDPERRVGKEMWEDPRYGENFNRWRYAKRHYTETHSMEDRDEMKKHANHHLSDTVDTLNEIWSEADPELRMKMKRELTELVSKMQA